MRVRTQESAVLVGALMALEWWIQQELNSWYLLFVMPTVLLEDQQDAFAIRCCIAAVLLAAAGQHSP
ncbi:hypothetical protein [Streptomyces sp. GbtcB6]|uniref:hypothetical protein n=1 Tax=Streptomyces sp. GbtcB6 TaxID=2824751 RepID=UPI001C2F39B1|nr:hypothetical protein [Streptomyces sp. GbtcB6]